MSEQSEHFKKQLQEFNHKNYKTNIELSGGFILKDFKINEGVLPPEKVAALWLARWLFFNNGIYKEKKVLDMGSGTGIQGIVCSLNGASKVFFSDISKLAIKNTQENIKNYELKNYEVIHGDLFENIKERFDIIIFNHPFFSDKSVEESTKLNETGIVAATFEKGKLIHKFLEQAKEFLNENGKIIMPYLTFAGEMNNPKFQAPDHNYKVIEKFTVTPKTGLHNKEICIFELSL